MINYYFLIEYSWDKKNGFSKKGFPRVGFISNNKFGLVNYEILTSVFTSQKMLDLNYVTETIYGIKKIINGEDDILQVYNESVGLDIKKDLTRVIDNLEMYGAYETGEESRSWNITTPIELQYIPTYEILQLFEDWKQFLEQAKEMYI